MSQPRPRNAAAVGGCCGVVIFSMVSGDRIGAAVEQGLRELREIVGGGKQSGVPGDAAHAARRWGRGRLRAACGCVRRTAWARFAARHAAGGRKRVCDIPSGVKICLRAVGVERHSR